MVVRQRLTALRPLVMAGHQSSISRSYDAQRLRIKIVVQSVPGVVPQPLRDIALRDILECIEQLQNLVVVDRGHTFTSGVRKVMIWCRVPPAPHLAGPADDGPPDDGGDPGEDESGPDGSRRRRRYPTGPSNDDPWHAHGAVDPWASSSSSSPLPKAPRRRLATAASLPPIPEFPFAHHGIASQSPSLCLQASTGCAEQFNIGDTGSEAESEVSASMRQQFDSLVQRVSHLERAFLFSDHLGALAPLPGLEDACCIVTPGMNIADRVAQAPAPFLPAQPSEAFNIGEPLVDSLPYFALPSVGPCLRPPSRRAPADQETRMAQVQAALIECMEPAEKIDGAEDAKSDIGPHPTTPCQASDQRCALFLKPYKLAA